MTGLAKNASFAIREQAGHSIKSALKVKNQIYIFYHLQLLEVYLGQDLICIHF